jgi:hypothetical protein
MTEIATHTETHKIAAHALPHTEIETRQLDEVIGGAKASGVMFLAFTFKLVAVKTVSWAHD